jgi:hypothetical protein
MTKIWLESKYFSSQCTGESWARLAFFCNVWDGDGSNGFKGVVYICRSWWQVVDLGNNFISV